MKPDLREEIAEAMLCAVEVVGNTRRTFTRFIGVASDIAWNAYIFTAREVIGKLPKE